MKHVSIHSIRINEGGQFSLGKGVDETGDYINFIDYTPIMKNILIDLMDYEVNPEHGHPAIYLESWQVQ